MRAIRMDARRNNFDLLRLLFAASVLLWHQHVLSGAASLEALSRLFSADLGVKGFFVVSGYLVVMSCEKSASLREYAEKRVRRIYPAYLAVVLLCAAGGLAVTLLPPSAYLGDGLLRYLAANLVFLNFLAPTLPGLFEGNAWHDVNGALWTLKVEVMFYALVPLIVASCKRFGAGATLVTLYVLSVAYGVALGAAGEASGRQLWFQLQRQLPGQLTYFLAGAAFYLYRERIEGRWGRLLAAGAAALLVERLAGGALLHAALEPLWVGIAVAFAAFGLPYLGNFARFGDLSYGIYIIHFPVIQVAVAAGLFARDPWLAFGLTSAVALLLAFLSWHWVEKRFLLRSSHYRVAAGA